MADQETNDSYSEQDIDLAGSSFIVPQLSLPKGGGAIRGIGEKFATNPVTGTGSLTVPIAISPGRSGFGPQLSLSYDSGTGNGPFGMGCKLSLPAITRKTDKGIPQYRDDEESDVFVLSGAEDLVPALIPDVNDRWIFDEFDWEVYRIKRYRPRIEGSFARIERWTRRDDGDVHWRSITKDNILNLYGFNAESRITDPIQTNRIFSWLICQSYDDRGNAILYDYLSENDEGVDLSEINERNRIRTVNRYLKRIRHGNRQPLLPDRSISNDRKLYPSKLDFEAADWMFETIFDYDDGHYWEYPPDDDGRIFAYASAKQRADRPWTAREDPFSSYRSGFEMRTHRLCRRALMFHCFPEELQTDRYLVRSAEFAYDEKPIGSFMIRFVQSGYKEQSDERYLKKSWPALDLTYTSSPLQDSRFDGYKVEDVDAASLENLPEGIDGGNYRWVDLDGEGINGVLLEQGPAWFYKPNLGNGRLGPTQTITAKPSFSSSNGGRQQLLDIAGDGNLDLVELTPSAPGFFERTFDAGWGDFRTFRSFPVQDWSNPNLKFIDVTGDGVADILITENEAVIWHPSLLKAGFGAGVRVRIPQDEEEGPRVVFADSAQSIYLADLSGDGLSDIVRIRNGEVCYWPNCGYGHFGSKVTMDNSPWFDEPDLFNQGRIRLADTDGSGTADILYIGHDQIRIFLNHSGNGWSEARVLNDFPTTDDSLATVSVVDFLGRGTACLLWSSSLPSSRHRPLRYLDLMSGQKPHLLVGIKNNLGAETHIEYASSTEFYLADKATGTPWITRLPFPVHVVKREETYDSISRNRFVTRYQYHHGYFDGPEREFRGFGLVEQIDTEEYALLAQPGRLPQGDNIDSVSNVPPVLTKTWFHTGAYLEGGRISKQCEHEYYLEGCSWRDESELSREQLGAMQLEDSNLPSHLTPEEAREACRALKGAMLRREVYGLDGTKASNRPYTVSEGNHTIKLFQARRGNRHAVFFRHAREVVSFNYERKLYTVNECQLCDPRVSHQLILAVDDYGNELQSVTVTYGRRHADSDTLLRADDRAIQRKIQITCKESSYTNPIVHVDVYRAPVLAQVSVYELIKITPTLDLPDVTNLFGFEEMARNVTRAGDGRHDLPFDDHCAAGATEEHPYRRLLKRTRILFRKNNLRGCLPLGEIESRALPFEQYKLSFTPAALSIYRRGQENLLPDPPTVLQEQGRYVSGDHQKALGVFPHADPDGCWWLPSGRVFYSQNPVATSDEELANARTHFFLPRRFQDAFGNQSTVSYDVHDLLVLEARDALENRITIGERTNRDAIVNGNDYRVLQPGLLTDPNGNRAAAAFDALGLVAGTAVMGKPKEGLGDSLAGFMADLSPRQLAEFFAAPKGPLSTSLLGSATTRVVYDLDRFAKIPSVAVSPNPACAATISRETHISDLGPDQCSKMLISITYSDGFGREIQRKNQAEPGPVKPEGPTEFSRWVGSGWTIYNNKGKPVRQYEPFFDVTHGFKFGLTVGVSSILLYDPLLRAVATAHPNHSWEKIAFDPWQKRSWDVNDTALISDPASDSDIGAFFQRIPSNDYLPTWYGARIDGALGAYEQAAAQSVAIHADTPATAVFDALGRTFLTISFNRSPSAGTLVESHDRTLIELDIEGNQRSVTDALDRKILVCRYDLVGSCIYHESADAGSRWILNNAAGKLQRSWDSRAQQFRQFYDPLQRPTRLFVRTANDSDKVVQHIVYGEDQPAGQARNLRTKVFQQFDQSGVVTNQAYDFKGNLLGATRQLAQEYRDMVDWSVDQSLEPQSFAVSSTYDALNRVVASTSADGSVVCPSYNEASFLEQLVVNLPGSELATPFVTHIDYNAKRQRELVEYGNGAGTSYTYDPDTSRLRSLGTTRRSDSVQLQDLSYVYDPVGNVTHIEDAAQQTIYFDNEVVTPSSAYKYDALYRLISATGREHLGQTNGQLEAPKQVTENDSFRSRLPQPGDGQAMGNYREHYQYDPVGNILQVKHKAKQGGWTRRYLYEMDSNRLIGTSSPGDNEAQFSARYTYDPHGNMLEMPHLPRMQWDFKDRLHATRRRIVTRESAEVTYYAYAASGQRIRKVTERSNGTKANERIYLGGFELYREYDHAGAIKLERQTLHVMDDQQRVALVETNTITPPDRSQNVPSNLTRYQLGNHLQSAVLELDGAGAIVSYEEYFPYGSTSYQAVRSRLETPKRYRFTGKELDEENGLNYHGARYYALWLGRWVSTDPVGMSGGANLFAYAFNNPVRLIDSLGTQPESLDNLPRDEEGNIFIGHEVIEIHDRAPPLSADEKARRGGTTDIVTLDEFERERNFNRYPPGYKRTLYDDVADAMWTTDPEGTAKLYYDSLNADYGQYRDIKAGELQEAWQQIDRAAGAVNEILIFEFGGTALAAGGAVLAPIAAGAAPAVAANAPAAGVITAGGGAVLSNEVDELEEELPVVQEEIQDITAKVSTASSKVNTNPFPPGTPYPGYNPGTFGQNDLVLGLYRGGNLNATIQITGGQAVTDVTAGQTIAASNAVDLSTSTISQIANSGGNIRVLLERLQNIPDVVAGRAFAGNITSAELQHLATNWEQFKNQVTFWLAGQQQGRPW
jgi:RHS repeat-associated protein